MDDDDLPKKTDGQALVTAYGRDLRSVIDEKRTLVSIAKTLNALSKSERAEFKTDLQLYTINRETDVASTKEDSRVSYAISGLGGALAVTMSATFIASGGTILLAAAVVGGIACVGGLFGGYALGQAANEQERKVKRFRLLEEKIDD